MTVLDYSKKMEQLCREAYLLKKDQVIELREVLEADKDGSNRIDPKIRCHVRHYAKMTSNCYTNIFWSSTGR